MKDGRILHDYANQTHVEIENEASVGMYWVMVRFETDEVREDPDGVTESIVEWKVTDKCQVEDFVGDGLVIILDFREEVGCLVQELVEFPNWLPKYEEFP